MKLPPQRLSANRSAPYEVPQAHPATTQRHVTAAAAALRAQAPQRANPLAEPLVTAGVSAADTPAAGPLTHDHAPADGVDDALPSSRIRRRESSGNSLPSPRRRRLASGEAEGHWGSRRRHASHHSAGSGESGARSIPSSPLAWLSPFASAPLAGSSSSFDRPTSPPRIAPFATLALAGAGTYHTPPSSPLRSTAGGALGLLGMPHPSPFASPANPFQTDALAAALTEALARDGQGAWRSWRTVSPESPSLLSSAPGRSPSPFTLDAPDSPRSPSRGATGPQATWLAGAMPAPVPGLFAPLPQLVPATPSNELANGPAAPFTVIGARGPAPTRPAHEPLP